MKVLHTQKGFTLVELAIVMTIIGLLIGGILKGQELMENTRTTATINQIKAYESATTIFQETYAGLPGDLVNASTRIAGCAGDNSCNPSTGATPNAGDGIFGSNVWSTTGAWGAQFHTAAAAINDAAAQTTVAAEPVLFWTHLLAADLISGVSSQGLSTPTPAQWGLTHPAAKIGGGFIVGHSSTAATLPGSPDAGTAIGGPVLVIAPNPGAALNATAGIQVMSALRAAIIDRKVDDGRPSAGAARAYGVAGSCFAGAAANRNYNEAAVGKDCGIMVQIHY